MFIDVSFNLAIQSATFCMVLAFRLNGVSPGQIGVAVAIAIIFMLRPASNAVVVAYQATVIPNEMWGRVESVRLTVACGLATLGPLIAGTLVVSVNRLLGPGLSRPADHG